MVKFSKWRSLRVIVKNSIRFILYVLSKLLIMSMQRTVLTKNSYRMALTRKNKNRQSVRLWNYLLISMKQLMNWSKFGWILITNHLLEMIWSFSFLSYALSIWKVALTIPRLLLTSLLCLRLPTSFSPTEFGFSSSQCFLAKIHPPWINKTKLKSWWKVSKRLALWVMKGSTL